jgi:hypothetical protein
MNSTRTFIEPASQSFFDSDELTEPPPDVLTAILLGTSQEFARHWLAGRSRTDIEHATALLAEAAWRSLNTSALKPQSRARRSGTPVAGEMEAGGVHA